MKVSFSNHVGHISMARHHYVNIGRYPRAMHQRGYDQRGILGHVTVVLVFFTQRLRQRDAQLPPSRIVGFRVCNGGFL